MKKIPSLLFTFWMFGCVNPSEQSTQVSFNRYDYSIDQISVSETIYSTEINENSISYFSTSDTIKYHLTFVPKFSGIVEKLNGDTSLLILEDQKGYTIDNNFYSVYKLSYDTYKLDAGVVLFWIEGVGLVVEKSTTWRDITKLVEHPDLSSADLEKLHTVILNDADFMCSEAISDEEERQIKTLDLDIES